MIFNMVIGLIIIFLIICFGVKYYTKVVRNKINLQIWEMLNEMFNVNMIDIKQFNINNTKQTLVLLQVIINALGDAMHYFKTEHKVCENELTTVCLDFAMQRCQELDIEVNQENEEFIKVIIFNYIQQHDLVTKTDK